MIRRRRSYSSFSHREPGSVAYFPEKYGAEILKVALDILHHRPVPPAVFVKHTMVTPDNVNHIYPNDELMGMSATALA